MSHPGEKRERFERLLSAAELAEGEAAHFADVCVERVEVSKAENAWTIVMRGPRLIPQDVYRRFCRAVRDKFRHVQRIRFVMLYDASVDDAALVNEYWSQFTEWAQHELASVNGWLAKASVDVRPGLLTVELPDAFGLEMAKRKEIHLHIREFFKKSFGRDYQVRLTVGDAQPDYEQFYRQVEAEDRALARELTEAQEASKGPEPEKRFAFGARLDGETPVRMADIRDEEKRVTIEGVVFRLERRELKNGSALFQLAVTDYTDSIYAKLFAKTKDELRLFSALREGMWLRLRGRVEYDRFMNPPELVLVPSDGVEIDPPPERTDDAPEKRVEFHLHTTMSTMDAVASAEDYIRTAAAWGHEAIAITDHANVQAFPEAYKAAKKYGIKLIYGMEANVVDDGVPIVVNAEDRDLQQTDYVVFDIETTGLSVTQNRIIEIAAVKMRGGRVVDEFATFVNPHEPIPPHIRELTRITDDMVAGAPDIEQVLPKFLEFVGDAVLVAHNARFDTGFLNECCRRLGLPVPANPVLDTLELARLFYPTLKNHKLNTLAEKFEVRLDQHHRAIDDSRALGEILFHMLKDAVERGFGNLNELNAHVGKDLSNQRPFHCCLYALNAQGKKNLFKLVSLSHTEYFNKVPCIPKSKLAEYREGILVASGCEKGELFEAVLNKSEEEAERIAEFYDVLEIQPPDLFLHLVDKGLVGSREALVNANRKIVELGKKLGKPVIATGNAHYIHPRDKIFRDITIHNITGFSPLKEQRKPDVHFRTTAEMLREFAELGEDVAYEVVVKNTRELAQKFETFDLFPKQLFVPKMEGAGEEMRAKCYEAAKRMYGDPLPEVVAARLEKELVPIIKAGYAVNYLICERLVKKSNEDGYLVGSRGSVGSSIVATMLGISEVNPLPPHYLCPACKYSEWFTDGSVRSGFDLEDKPCPKCGATMKGDGQDIPFETFLGFKGDKVPDIDLNFSGEYQARAHQYTKELFGEKNVFRAGTIGTVADKTAFGFVKKYEEDHGKKWRAAELERLAAGCTGVKRSTGQHPGGIVVVPDYIEVEDVTPVQYPADDTSSEWKTTHFDYHAFEDNLLKLDILGHDDPTMMRMLYELTGVDPTTIPMNDKKVLSIFRSTEALGVTPEQIRSPVATYGIPEMGTKFVRQMLEECQPKTFSDLLQISGLSHGTGVWIGNAQELIRSGVCTIETVIGCRDEIMLYLIYKAGMDASLAFQITESVRKGKGLTPEWIEAMKRHGVPQWYIDSCLKIEYMFPKAHAAAYVTSAVRTAYYKVYHPVAFYAAFFTVRAEDFDVELCVRGYDAIRRRLEEIEEKGSQATAKEKNMIPVLEMALEMTARGFSFRSIDLYRSDATRFLIDGDALIPPFSAVAGIGESAANNIAAARRDGPFLSVEDFQMRTRVSKTVVELLAGFGCFDGMPETNQLSLF